ncbi:MAG: low molecular weight protein-tyrosine-phosphatase [Bacilli bacterium]|nr:low molecular weight protein-tyrosine-phosphatase [Bacilli bacterium]MDY6430314.1 low molecular weight protein-tyrosine-phosphatase [Bacilli bacterium]
MKNIIFVCHGNICRSPAAEFVMKSLTDKFSVISRATSYEEIGNDIYPPMKRALNYANIPFSRHSASRITKEDHDWADIIFYMDEENEYSLRWMFPSSIKIFPIFAYTSGLFSIEDPWYTGRYEKVLNQITRCVKDIISNLN